jgi:hypothetical protein
VIGKRKTAFLKGASDVLAEGVEEHRSLTLNILAPNHLAKDRCYHLSPSK